MRAIVVFLSVFKEHTLPSGSVSADLAGRSFLPIRQKSSMNPSRTQKIHATFTFGGDTQIGGDDRDRTGDPLLAKQVLSQLSYIPPRFPLPGKPTPKKW